MAEYSATVASNEALALKGLKSHPYQGSNLALATLAQCPGRPFGAVDVESVVVAGASYAEPLVLFVACEVDNHAVVEVYAVHTSGPDVRVGYMDNCTVDCVGVAVKESALVAVSGKNRHCLHHQHTAADNVQSVGAIQAVDESDDVD